MSKINDGGPAFAAMGVSPAGDVFHEPGMSLRDWFAGQALAGLAANPNESPDEGSSDFHELASVAYELADAMILARSNRGEERNG